MANHPTTEGDTRGLSPEPAGSQPISGKRLCPSCHGYRYLFPLAGRQPEIKCPMCKGTGFEPLIAPRPGSSLFSPPAPSQQLEGRRAALTEAEERLVITHARYEAAAAQYERSPMILTHDEMVIRRDVFVVAAARLARTLSVRAEGGLNTKL
jgi:hypothetical protein